MSVGNGMNGEGTDGWQSEHGTVFMVGCGARGHVGTRRVPPALCVGTFSIYDTWGKRLKGVDGNTS